MFFSSLILPDNAKRRARLTAILWVLTLFGCQPERPAAPMCRTSTGALPVLPAATTDRAICLMHINGNVLMVRHRSSGLLALPSVVKSEQESLRCAAHRAVWEQTGLNVEVGQRLTHTSNGKHIFACRSEALHNGMPDTFLPPSWARADINQITMVKPFELSHQQLHNQAELIPLRDAAVIVQRSKPK